MPTQTATDDQTIARALREVPEAFARGVASRIEREIFARTRWVPATSAVAGALVAVVMRDKIQTAWLVGWLAVMFAAAGIRLVFNRHVLETGSVASARVVTLTTLAAAASGAFWGSLVWLPLAAPDPVATFFAAAVVAGIVAGASVSYASAPRIMLAVTLPAISSTVVAMALRGDSFGYGTAVLLLVLGGIVYVEARRNRRAVEVQIAHEVLLERARDQVQGREALLRLGADALPELIAYIDTERRVLFANRRYVERQAMPRDKLIGSPLKLLYPNDFGVILPYLDAALAGAAQDFEYRPADRGRQGAAMRMRFVPDLREDGGVRGVFSVTMDGEIAAGEALRALEAGLDTLLDDAVFKKRAALQHEQLRRNGGEHALCLVDLDLAIPADTPSTPQSRAEALAQVAIALRHTVRGSDLIGRIRDDEFALLFLDCPQHTALGRCEQLVSELGERSRLRGGGAIALRASVGITALRGVDPTLESAMTRAENATEAARKSGGNRVIQR
jgi:diguanylate cyclase (GGDEF)-like protein